MFLCRSCSTPSRSWLTFGIAAVLALGFGPFGLLYRQAPLAGLLLLLGLFGAVGLLTVNPLGAFVLFLFFKALYLVSVGLALYCAWPASRSV